MVLKVEYDWWLEQTEHALQIKYFNLHYIFIKTITVFSCSKLSPPAFFQNSLSSYSLHQYLRVPVFLLPFQISLAPPSASSVISFPSFSDFYLPFMISHPPPDLTPFVFYFSGFNHLVTLITIGHLIILTCSLGIYTVS